MPFPTTASKADLLARKSDLNASIRALRDKYTRTGQTHLSADDDRQIESLLAEREQVEVAIERANNVNTAVPARPAYDRVARVGYEARTYRPDEDPTGKQFLLDISRNFLFQDPASQERLQRHAQEERVERPGYQERAVGTGAYAG